MAENTTDLPSCYNITGGAGLDKVNDKFFSAIFLPSFIFTLIMFVIGGTGNAIVFYIYFAKWSKTTARIFILALAGFDLINCFLTMPMELVVLKNFLKFDSSPTCKVFRYITFMMNNGSSIVLAGIAIDRYRRICNPLKKQLETKQAKIVVILAGFFAVVFAWPALVLYGTQTLYFPISKNPYMCVVAKTCLIEDRYVHTDWPLVFTLVMLTGNIIIDIGLITCYSIIGYQIIKRGNAIDPAPSMKMRKASVSTLSTDDNVLDGKKDVKTEQHQPLKSQVSITSNDKGSSGEKHRSMNPTSPTKKREMFRQRSLSVASIEARRTQMYKTTFMLFMVTALFMGSFIPYCIIVIIRCLNKSYYSELSIPGKAAYNLFLRTYMLSSSLNPVIYSFFSVQFREKCKEVFRQLTGLCRKE